MAGEGVAFFAVDQDLHFQNAWGVGRDGVDQRGDGQFFDQDAGAVSVGEGGVQVDDGDSGIDQKDAADVGAGAEHVGRGLVEIEGEQGAQKFFGALLASGGQRNQGRLGAQAAIVIVRDVEGDALGRSGDGGASGRVSVAATGVAAADLRMCQAIELRPSAATSSTDIAMRRWRGIMVCASWFASQVAASLRGSELIAGGRDRGGDGAGDQLLVVGRGELRGIGSLGRDFDGDGGADDVIQRTEWGGQGADRDLPPLQFGGDGGGGALAQGQRGMLGGGPGSGRGRDRRHRREAARYRRARRDRWRRRARRCRWRRDRRW